jgi:TetR/AcrR family transcriptional regulator
VEKEITTEQKILEAAETEFLAEGLAGARMQTIADKAGINKALLHYYFRSKDKLFEVVFNWKLSQFVPQVSAVVHQEDMPFLEKLDLFIMGYMRFVRQNPSVPVFMVSTMHRNPDLAKRIQTSFGEEVVALMRREMEKGNIRTVDPHHFLLSVLGMCVFPVLARPIASRLMVINDETYDRILEERHLHVMQYARSILTL